ncbi:MAG TPA: histidine phosphatase family protein [Clostridiales bacterium]|nr:histidine phosphatase family protein [Clostridiales bacterium]
MVNLYLIRHGRQNSTLCNTDVPLSQEGIAQCELLRERLTKYRLDAIYSSDMLRARQTAEIINEAFGLPHGIRAEFREISFGLMEGKTDEYNDEHFREFYEEQSRLIEDIPYPGGENGTSVYERAMPVLQELARSGKKDILIVTHGGVIRSILAALFGRNQARRFLFATSLENASITQLRYDLENDRFYLERFNDCAHLEGNPELRRRGF